MRVVLDTGALYRPRWLQTLANLPVPGVLPAVAFAERARQLRKRDVPVPSFVEALREMDLVVEPFTEPEALRYAVHVHDDEDWGEVARDAFIAGHVREDDVLWTTNPRDFLDIGVPDEQVVDVLEDPPT